MSKIQMNTLRRQINIPLTEALFYIYFSNIPVVSPFLSQCRLMLNSCLLDLDMFSRGRSEVKNATTSVMVTPVLY